MKKVVIAICATALISGVGLEAAKAGKPQPPPPTTGRDVRVFATNDLGMHCVCMGFDTFVLLPPFNTLRAQVIERDVAGVKGGTPTVLADPADIRVEYDIVENTEASLDADPNYQSWVTNSPKLFPGYNPKDPATGEYVGLAGFKLRDAMEARTSEGWWEAVGIPAYPSIDSHGPLIDPLGGPNRNPYLTGNVKVYDQADGTLLAESNTTVPTAFGGCCACHIDLAANNGYPADPYGSFDYMGVLHQRDSGINIANIDPDGDGKGGPIRCSQCHLDPAMGESTPPGYAGYPTSQYTFSDVLHRFHAQSTEVLTNWNPNIATDCYQCHPGNGINCYRGHHTNKTIGNRKSGHLVWCTDCHGDLNQRIAEGQLTQPWSQATLPVCDDCHSPNGEGGGNLGVFGGVFLNSRGHKNDKILCSTCHGEPHALYPSTLAKDNERNLQYQNDARAIGVCDTCHVGKSTSWAKPMH